MSKYAHLMKDTKSSAIRTNHLKNDKMLINNFINKTNIDDHSVSPLSKSTDFKKSPFNKKAYSQIVMKSPKKE
jgi:hypothetical protein